MLIVPLNLLVLRNFHRSCLEQNGQRFDLLIRNLKIIIFNGSRPIPHRTDQILFFSFFPLFCADLCCKLAIVFPKVFLHFDFFLNGGPWSRDQKRKNLFFDFFFARTEGVGMIGGWVF